jgi:hypothetical protein
MKGAGCTRLNGIAWKAFAALAQNAGLDEENASFGGIPADRLAKRRDAATCSRTTSGVLRVIRFLLLRLQIVYRHLGSKAIVGLAKRGRLAAFKLVGGAD